MQEINNEKEQANKDKVGDSPDKNKNLLKKMYFPAGIFLFLFFGTQINMMVEYCILQTETSYYDFWLINSLVHVDRVRFSTFIVCMIFLIIYCLCTRWDVSALITGTVMFLFAFADHNMYVNRNELINYKDLSLTEAAGTAWNSLNFGISKHYLLMIGFIVLMTLCFFAIEKYCRSDRKPAKWVIYLRIGMIILAITVTPIVISAYNKYENKKALASKKLLVVEENCHNAVYRFFAKKTVSFGAEGVMDSYDYFKNRANDWSEEHPRKSDIETPNVIVIMNEAWWDYSGCDQSRISFGADPMKTYNELASQCVDGHVSVNIYGGGTVMTEYEFLTGVNSKYFLQTNGAYSVIREREKTMTIVDYFNDLSYETISIHPYYGDFYNRDVVYQKFNFDKIIFNEDMKYKEEYDKFISDESLANQIIYEYETKEKNEDVFIWAVSIGNHTNVLSYDHEAYENYPYEIQVNDPNGYLNKSEKDTVTSFVSGNELASQSYKKLVEYFGQQDEPTVILMFGDHVPNFETAAPILGIDQKDSNPESAKMTYCTPILLWKNYTGGESIEPPEGDFVGSLGAKLIDFAGLPECEMQRIYDFSAPILKTDTLWFTLDGEGKIIQTANDEQMELLNNLKVLQYDQIYGSNQMNDLWKPILPDE